MRTSEVIEIDSVLGDNDTFTFNPSISHWKDDLYLCSYRSFKRYNNIDVVNREANPFFEPNHPWLGGNNSATWWRTVSGLDATGFSTIRFKDEKFQNVYNYKNVELFSKDGNIATGYSKLLGVDTRILHLKGDFFIVSYNKYYKDASRVKTGTCENGCFSIATRLLKLSDDKIIFFGENIMCPQISNTTEKNWSFWTYRGNIFFSYSLVPKHFFYKVELNLSDGSMNCQEYYLDGVKQLPFAYGKSKYYDRVENYYNSKEKKILHISLSTPSIPKKNSEAYISVGHVKYLNGENIKLVQNSPLGIFYNQHTNYKRHPIYDYLMFLYEFNPYDGKIIRVSDMFLPSDTDYVLAFPSGISYDMSGNLLISYGDHDTKSKVCIIGNNFVEKMLYPVEKRNVLSVSNTLNDKKDKMSPQELNFFILPKYCQDLVGMCKIIADI